MNEETKNKNHSQEKDKQRSTISLKFKPTVNTSTKSTPKPSNHYKPDQDQYIKTREICRLFGVYESTVRNWELTGKIKAIKTPTGHRRFDKSSILAYLAKNQTSQEDTQKGRINIIYCRVSSTHQQNDLQRQIDYLQSKYPDHQLVKDIGSGLNFKRKGLKTILDHALKGDIGQVVVAHRDRLARFGVELIEYLLTQSGGSVIVAEQVDSMSGKSTDQELAEDLLSIVAVFNARQMGKKRYNQKLKDSNQSKLSNGSINN